MKSEIYIPIFIAFGGIGMVTWLLYLLKLKPEKSAMATGTGIGLTFTIGLLFTLLIPSFNKNWSASTADNESMYHAVYKAEGGLLYRQWPDGSQSLAIQTEDPNHPDQPVSTAAAEYPIPDGTIVGYTPLEEHGRRVYQREGCMYCHTQQVRPLYGDEKRSSVGASLALPADEREYVFDQPHFLGTRRIGPDLSREGGKYSDDWHYSHFFSPRQMVPGSIMPAFTWLFTKDADNNPVPTYDARGLVAYVQTLGYGRLVHNPAVYKSNGGWGPWMMPADQQLYQKKGNEQVERARTPIYGHDQLSPTNKVLSPAQ